MENKETLSSGNYLTVNLAPVTEAFHLLQIIIYEFAKQGLDLKIDRKTEINFMEIFENNTKACLAGLAGIITSPNLLPTLQQMATRCIYEVNGVRQKIDNSTFEDENARSDFFEVYFKIAVRNIKPFFPKALSK